MTKFHSASVKPRYRVISDNDYAGDPDGLFQLAQLALSSAVDTVAVIGSNFRGADAFGVSGKAADASTVRAREILKLCRRADIPAVAGSNEVMTSRTKPLATDATAVLIKHAMATHELPLFFVCGGGLTTIASAWLLEPRIAERLTLVWIGGPEHEGLAFAPPNPDPMEYNLSIDHVAAQVVFNDSNLKIWQVPRDVYRQANVSMAELKLRVGSKGKLGKLLYKSLVGFRQRALVGLNHNLGETYILGDSPLVLITALQSNFHPDASSSPSVMRARPSIDDQGQYGPSVDHEIRVFTQIDNRLMFEDLYAKLALLAS